MKSGTIDYVGEVNPRAKSGNSGIAGGDFASINHQPFATSAERRCSGHTWSVTARSCPSGAEGAALVDSCSSYPVQGCVFDVHGT